MRDRETLVEERIDTFVARRALKYARELKKQGFTTEAALRYARRRFGRGAI